MWCGGLQPVSHVIIHWNGRATLQTRLNHIQRMDRKRRDCAGGEASDGLDQRGREARMVFGHEGNFWCIMLEWVRKRKEKCGDDLDVSKRL